MKLTAIYTKLENGKIRATIRVDEENDFPASRIFSRDTVTNAGSILPGETTVTMNGDKLKLQEISYVLREWDSSKDSWDYSTPELAKEAVKVGIAYLKEKLDEWRAIEFPHSETFDI